jgi:hypothetical protein
LSEKIRCSALKEFGLLSHIKGNAINGCDFLNYIPSIRVGQCDYWAWAPKDLA